MIKSLLLPLTLVVAALTGCSSIPTSDILIHTEASSKADFAGYTTYGWVAAATLVADSAGAWKAPEFDPDAEIKYLIDRELRARGMSETRTDPDIAVAFVIGVDMDALRLKEDPETELELLSNVPSAGLLVAMIDVETGFVIWAGLADGEVQPGADAGIVKGRLEYVIREMIAQLPR